ncbi:MAG: GDP-L-fucose synthase [Caldisericia bacterium]|nr:GDP-L-fucose synthase [Caldisericia bacterium]
MNKNSKIFVAGVTGLVGSAIVRKLIKKGYTNIIGSYHSRNPQQRYQNNPKNLQPRFIKLDLRRQEDTESFFEQEKPDYVFLAAAKVGGILANNTYKAEFIYDNLMIAANVINSAYKFGVKKLLNLGSSCIYPKFAPQPMKEEYLLTNSLEPTNEPYAIAKIAAIKLCRYYNEQYGTNFVSVMPTNLYGPNDNFHLLNSHVLPALIRKFHLAKLLQQGDFEAIKKDFIRNKDNKTVISNSLLVVEEDSSKDEVIRLLSYYGIKYVNTSVTVTLWGTGKSYREFLYVDDLADVCIYLMENHDYKDIGEFVNIGVGEDITIKDLAFIIKDIVGFKGEISFDTSKPDGTPRKLLDISRILRLGWQPKVSLREGIGHTYKWYTDMYCGL